MSDSSFTFCEFFAGAGMAREGLGDRWTCSLANDCDESKAQTYAANWGDDHLIVDDVWNLAPDQLDDDIDLAWASSPCQDFSLAGTRTGLAGDRSSAFLGFWRLVEAKRRSRRPKIVVLENVLGLLSSNEGRDFAEVCAIIVTSGYWIGCLEIDASMFVPQSRPRLFLVCLRSRPASNVVQAQPGAPFHSDRVVRSFRNLDHETQQRWVWWKLPRPDPRQGDLASITLPPPDVQWHTEKQGSALLDLLSPLHRDRLDWTMARNTLTVGVVARRMRVEAGHKRQRAELRFDGLSGCIRTPRGGSSNQSVITVDGASVRTRPMQAREAARLMGLRDTFQLPRGRTRALHVVGDGVSPPVVNWLASHLLAQALE